MNDMKVASWNAVTDRVVYEMPRPRTPSTQGDRISTCGACGRELARRLTILSSDGRACCRACMEVLIDRRRERARVRHARTRAMIDLVRTGRE